MLNTPEPDDTLESMPMEYPADRFTPRWSDCSGMFNDGGGLSSRENEEVHYRKHAVIGREWGHDLSLSDYCSQATQHLNDLNSETVIELCQAEDLAVVKYNLDSGELGIARRDDGSIKTFFRPNDVSYILRKTDTGMWGEPSIADGFEIIGRSSDFADDAEKLYLFGRLESIAIELPSQAHSVVIQFAGGTPPTDELVLLLARLGEYRFIAFEMQRRILTEAQGEAVFSLRKKVVVASASFEGLERHCSHKLVPSVAIGLGDAISRQEHLWSQSAALISDLDGLDFSLSERGLVGYAMLEMKILQLHRRMLGVDLTSYEYRLRKSDIYLRNFFYPLAKRFAYRETHLVSPEGLFWRRMGKNLS